MRPSWDNYFLNIAEAVSRRATCPRASVGAVIASPDHRILATGYNGAVSGSVQCDEAGCLMEDGHCQRTLHAEVNAVAFAARFGARIEGAGLYLYIDRRGLLGDSDVCRECEKVLRAAGVAVVNIATPDTLQAV